jgi:hypothetical protein
VQVLADSTPIFSGVVKDWDIEYDLEGQYPAIAYCSDLFTIMANATFVEELETVDQNCDERLISVLNYFGYVFDTDFDVGNANLGAFPISANTLLLDYIFNVAFSDQGNIFVTADNVLTFTAKYGREPISELTFADDGTGIGYSSLTNELGDELLFNKVAISSPAAQGLAEDATSIAAYGEAVFIFDKALNKYQLDSKWIAESVLDLYNNPGVRFTGLSVELAGLSSADVEDVLLLDLADQVSVKKSFAVGSPSSVTQDLIVTGIRHRIVPGSHIVEFSFEPTPYRVAFVLDDAVLGELDDNDLG